MHMATLDGTAPPPSLLSSVVDAGWDSVGGHADVVRQLKEMVMLPLLYPELLRDMHITAPRCVHVRRQCRHQCPEEPPVEIGTVHAVFKRCPGAPQISWQK